MNVPVPDWKLERYRLGELPGDELVALGRRLADDPELRRRLDALDEDSARFLAAHPPRPALVLHPTNRAPVWALAGVGLALAAGVAVAIRVPSPGAPVPTDRPKGVPTLYVHRSTPTGEVQALGDGATAHPGDLLQLSYVPGGEHYGVIVSVDGAGEVTTHVATADGHAVALSPEGAALDHAWELDDAPGFERFFFVTADVPFDADTVVDAARRLAQHPDAARTAPLPLPADLEQRSLLLDKDPR